MRRGTLSQRPSNTGRWPGFARPGRKAARPDPAPMPGRADPGELRHLFPPQAGRTPAPPRRPSHVFRFQAHASRPQKRAERGIVPSVRKGNPGPSCHSQSYDNWILVVGYRVVNAPNAAKNWSMSEMAATAFVRRPGYGRKQGHWLRDRSRPRRSRDLYLDGLEG